MTVAAIYRRSRNEPSPRLLVDKEAINHAHHTKFATDLVRHVSKYEHTHECPGKRQTAERAAIHVVLLELFRVDFIEYYVRGCTKVEGL